jgi:GAF domain-containing protein
MTTEGQHAVAGGTIRLTHQDRYGAVVRRCGEPPTDEVDRGTAKVYDLRPAVQTLPRFAMVLRADHDLTTALARLTDGLASVLGLSGIGITVAEEDGLLRVVTAVGHACGELERNQEEEQSGPCRDVYDTGEVVRVTDLREEPGRWPEFSAAADRLHVAGVAGIPMRLAHNVIGALSLYSSQPRDWSDDDLALARVMADVATSYIVSISKLRHQENVKEQLQEALKSRIVIEQAKGMTASRHSVTIDQAYRLIRRYARNHNARLRVVAEAIVAHGPSGLSPVADLPDQPLRCAVSQASSMPSLTVERQPHILPTPAPVIA